MNKSFFVKYNRKVGISHMLATMFLNSSINVLLHRRDKTRPCETKIAIAILIFCCTNRVHNKVCNGYMSKFTQDIVNESKFVGCIRLIKDVIVNECYFISLWKHKTNRYSTTIFITLFHKVSMISVSGFKNKETRRNCNKASLVLQMSLYINQCKKGEGFTSMSCFCVTGLVISEPISLILFYWTGTQ